MRVVVVRLNRYGLAFAENKTPSTYKHSGRSFASYYRVACTRCGMPFAGPSWQRHDLKDCDRVIRQDERGEFSKLGIADLKRRHLHGDTTKETLNMRRPSKTKSQRDYERVMRALRRLQRAAVRWSEQVTTDTDGSDDGDPLINALTDLQAAADAYTTSLSPKERRKLLR